MNQYKEPFSLSEIMAEPQVIISNTNFYKTSDSSKLAYYRYQSQMIPRQTLIFIHGGGACSSLGYQYLAETLSQKFNTTVYLLDIRGHGLSEGKRGDAPTTARIWKDISEFIDFVRLKTDSIPLYLGGHSSGGGLVLNYSTWKERKDVNGYIFVSPKLGYKSNTDRYSFTNDPFAHARIGTILLNKISNGIINSHAVAVEMNYSQEMMNAEPLIVDKYTCNLVNAITPSNPDKQFHNIDRPFYLCIGENDELILPEKTIKYLRYANDIVIHDSVAEIIAEQNHLGILRVTGESIGRYLSRNN